MGQWAFSVREAGGRSAQRNTFYEPIKVWHAAPMATETESRPVGSKSKVLEDNLTRT